MVLVIEFVLALYVIGLVGGFIWIGIQAIAEATGPVGCFVAFLIAGAIAVAAFH